MNTVEQGRIYFSDFSKVFKLDAQFFDVMQWNIEQLLMFVIPIVFFLLSIKFAKKWIQIVFNGIRSAFRHAKSGSSSDKSSYDASKFQKSSVKAYKPPKYDYYGWKERVERRRAQRLMRG